MDYGIILFFIASLWTTDENPSISTEWYYPRIHYNFASSSLYGYYGGSIYPHAICKGDTTYVVWENNAIDPEIIMYDDITNNWSNSVIVGNNPLIWLVAGIGITAPIWSLEARKHSLFIFGFFSSNCSVLSYD